MQCAIAGNNMKLILFPVTPRINQKELIATQKNNVLDPLFLNRLDIHQCHYILARKWKITAGIDQRVLRIW